MTASARNKKRAMQTDRKTARKKGKKTNIAFGPESRTNRFPLIRSGRQIGSVTLGLELSADASPDDKIYALHWLSNALVMYDSAEEDILIDDRLRNRKRWGLNIAVSFVYFQPLPKAESDLTKPSLIQEKANEAVFLDMIKEFGAKAFRNPEVNRRIDSWLKDKKNAGNSINRIANDLPPNIVPALE
jgi:hypothetical protein